MTRLKLKNLDMPNLARHLTIDRFPFTIGRHSSCDLRVDLPFVSRHHVLLTLRNDEVWAQDLESLNGTYLNGAQLLSPQPIHSGDLLAIGPITFRAVVKQTSFSI